MIKLLRNIKIVQVVFLTLGLILFFYIIYSVGVGQIWDSIRLMGFGFVLVVLASAVRHLLRTIAWLNCIEEDHRNIKLWDLFNVRIAGDAVRLLSFTGPFLGETSKAVLIRKRLPMVHGMSSIIIENLTYTVGVIFVVITGLGLFISNYSTRTSVKWAGAIMSICMVLALAAFHFLISRRIMFFSRVGRWLARKTDITWFKSQAMGIEETETRIHDFYLRRGSTFYVVLVLGFAANFVNLLEVYLILYFMNVDVTFLASYIIEAMMKIVNILFFFVPGQVGVLEGGNAFVFKVLGLGLTAGVTLSLVEKIRTIFWGGYGLAVWMHTFHKRSEDKKRSASIAVGDLTPKEVFND
ncbi:MAG: lysylphosphatidylglycerol synthase domain-containing protein [Pyrinomonadaceae bacterium]